MIAVKKIINAIAHLVINIALDKQHRRMAITFKNSTLTMECGWNGNDIVLKVKDARGQISERGVVVPKKKIILPPGVK